MGGEVVTGFNFLFFRFLVVLGFLGYIVFIVVWNLFVEIKSLLSFIYE